LNVVIDGMQEKGRKSLPGFAVATILIAALDASAVLLADFLYQERGLARRARFGHGAIPESKLTLGVITAREK